MFDDEQDDQERLAEVAERLRAGRRALAMTVYAIEHGRRTPAQVRAVVERAARAIYRNNLVRKRWTGRRVVH